MYRHLTVVRHLMSLAATLTLMFAGYNVASAAPATPAAAAQCRLVLNTPVTAQQTKNLKAKGYTVVILKRTLEQYKAAFSIGDFGFQTYKTTRGEQSYILWRLDRGHIGTPVIDIEAQNYFKTDLLKNVKPSTLDQVYPNCAELKAQRNKMAFDYTMRVKTAQSKEAIIKGLKSDLKWGEFFIDAEATFMNGENFDRRLKWEKAARAQYNKILGLASSLITVPDGMAQLEGLRRVLHSQGGLKNYCRDNWRLLDFVLRAKPCGNCVAQTLMIVSVIKDLGLTIPKDNELAVQTFRDHVRPVLYNRSKDEILDLMTGQVDEKKSGTIFKPEILFWSFQRSLYYKDDSSRHWYYSTLQARKDLVIRRGVLISATEDLIAPFFKGLMAIYPSQRAYEFDMAQGRFSLQDPPEKMTIQFKSMNKVTPAAQKKTLMASFKSKFSTSREVLEGRKQLQLRLVDYKEIFDADEVEFLNSKQILSSSDPISLIKKNFKMVEITERDGKEFVIVHAVRVTCEHEAGDIGLELDLPVEIRIHTLVDADYCYDYQALNTYDRFKTLLGTVVADNAKLIDGDKTLNSFYNFLNTGNINSQCSALDGQNMYLLNQNFMIIKRTLEARWPKGVSANPKYSFDVIAKDFYQTQHGFIYRRLGKKLFSRLYGFYKNKLSLTSYINMIKKAERPSNVCFKMIMENIITDILDPISQLGVRKDSKLQDMVSELSGSPKFLSYTESMNVLSPLRKILLSLLNDREKFYVPQLSASERVELSEAFENMKASPPPPSPVNASKSNLPSSNQIRYFDPLPKVFELRKNTMAEVKKETPIWDRPVIELSPAILADLFAFQLSSDKRRAEFQLPITMRWTQSLQDQDLERKYGNQTYWMMEPRVVLEKITQKTRLPLRVLADFDANYVNPILSTGVRRDVIDEAHKFYFRRPDMVYFRALPDALAIDDPFRIGEFQAFPYRFQPIPKLLAKKLLTECGYERYMDMLICSIEKSPQATVNVRMFSKAAVSFKTLFELGVGNVTYADSTGNEEILLHR